MRAVGVTIVGDNLVAASGYRSRPSVGCWDWGLKLSYIGKAWSLILIQGVSFVLGHKIGAVLKCQI